ncbi:lytic transglycosylase, partial [Thioclava sp. BHET1]
VASCGYSGPPSDLNDACAIVRQRPNYLRAMRASERQWGVPIYVQMAFIHQESRFVRNARTPYRWSLGIIPMGRASSAYGYAQALDTTWDDYRRETGHHGASRRSIWDATDFIGWYMNKASATTGIQKWDARDQYLAYHEGIAGFSRGSYRSKTWLIRVAGAVEGRSDLYRRQLVACGIRP